MVDNGHWNRIGALAYALAKMKRYGTRYARQVVRNAQTLSCTLFELRLPITQAATHPTESHQILLKFGELGGARREAASLEAAGRVVDGGMRVSTSAVTRRGMKDRDAPNRRAHLGYLAATGGLRREYGSR